VYICAYIYVYVYAYVCDCDYLESGTDSGTFGQFLAIGCATHSERRVCAYLARRLHAKRDLHVVLVDHDLVHVGGDEASHFRDVVVGGRLAKTRKQRPQFA